MRIRIVKRPAGRVDGVPLDRFEPGVVYEVNASIGSYLMAMGHAQAVTEAGPARVIALDSPAATVKRATVSYDSAHERARKKK